MNRQKLPEGWDQARTGRVVQHYEGQTQGEAVAEDEAALREEDQVWVEVPCKLLPVIREAITHSLAPNPRQPS